MNIVTPTSAVLSRTIKAKAPRPLRWTRKNYIRLYRLGMLGEHKVELIGGRIEVMSPQFDYHAGALSLTLDALKAAFGPSYWVRPQATLNLGPGCMPDPDVSVVLGSAKGATRVYAKTAELVVEISDSSLPFDRTRKSSTYAAHGVADYWIVNLIDNQLEIYRQPMPDATQNFGYAFGWYMTLKPGSTASPLALPSAIVQVADLFP